MAGGKRKGDPWRHLTVYDHISAPVTSQSELVQQRTLTRRRNLQVNSAQNDHVSAQAECPMPAHISAPVTSQSELYQQRTLTRRHNHQVDSAQSDHISSPVSTQFDPFRQ